MKVELTPYVGVQYDGLVVEHAQWNVYVIGLLAGYLSHDETLPIMLFRNHPDNILKEILTKCEAIVSRPVLPPYPIYEPPEIDNSAGEDIEENENEEEEADDDQ